MFSAGDRSSSRQGVATEHALNLKMWNQQQAYEIVPNRLDIATRLLAGMLAYSENDRIDHIMHADCLVSNAVLLADKLIARVRATHK